jgi:hypothetical protein
MRRKRYNRLQLSAATTVLGVLLHLHVFRAIVFSLVASVAAWTLQPLTIRNCPAFPNTGVTSLHPWKESDGTQNILIAGTKNGRIFRRVAVDADDWILVNPKGVYDSKYPLYSLTSSFSHLFCGGGNRYISVWSQAETNDNPPTPLFHYQQELGPHTGWVKDLVYDHRHALLHSIGCNCIETWDCSSQPFQHYTKRSIENSPTMGTTLSSDLLCLALIETNNEICLVSGGVDGRIHLWQSDPRQRSWSGGQLLDSKRVHNGRVNKIMYSAAIDAILSVGNDGTLSACRIRKVAESNVSIDTLASFNMGASEDDLRLTALSFLGDNTDKMECIVAAGSADGQVLVATVKANDNGEVEYTIDM